MHTTHNALDYPKQPVAGEDVPNEPCDARPFAGTTLKTVPFHVSENARASEGHDWRYGPPALVDVAHASPAGGLEPLSAR
jgi:hypothetical protein